MVIFIGCGGVLIEKGERERRRYFFLLFYLGCAGAIRCLKTLEFIRFGFIRSAKLDWFCAVRAAMSENLYVVFYPDAYIVLKN